ncbi:MAG: cyclase family protein [Gemmatimonadaceae bacterium]
MIDISIPFDHGTPEWPGDTPFTCGWSWSITEGASVNVSKWTLSPHVGTHADAPLHVSAEGAGADRLPVAPFLGEALVVDVSHVHGVITLDDLRHAGYGVETTRLLVHTGRTVAHGEFPASWPTLDPHAARTIARAGLRLCGVDCPSVDDRESKALEVHHALFDGDAHVLENLDLRGVTPGRWELVALPLKVGALDAAPVRAFLRPLG